MAAHPGMVSGRGRFDTMIIGASAGRILSKGGAEGVHAAALPDTGIGVAVKIDDGGKRAAEAAMAAVLLDLRPAGPAASVLAGYARQPLRNTLGAVIGEIRTAPGWLAG
jgi:L-asparaginase II